jgi:hypothetical protein
LFFKFIRMERCLSPRWRGPHWEGSSPGTYIMHIVIINFNVRQSFLSVGTLSWDHRVSRVLSFFSSRRNWGSPNPSPASECALPPYQYFVVGMQTNKGKGRSRLDFFITSNNITDMIKNCQIKPHLQNKMFDHKAVSICFNDPPKVISRPTISREILSDPDLELHVALAVADTYLIHTAVLDEATRTRLLLEVGTAKNELRQIGPDKKYFHEGYRSVLEENTRAAKIGNIRDVIESLPFLRLQTGNFTENLTDDLFMEALMNNIRNECISYQTFLAKTVKESTGFIKDRLKILKQDFVLNQTEILELEKKLDAMIDSSLRSKLETTSNY